LVQDKLHLLFERHTPEERIQRLAAGHAVLVVVAAAIRACDKMLDARLGLRKWIFAEETQSPLSEHQPVERFRRHGRLTFGFRRAPPAARRPASRCSVAHRADSSPNERK